MFNINENSLWEDDPSKEVFLKSPTKVGNAFWINYLGNCCLYDHDKDSMLLHTYLNTTIRPNSVKEDANDLPLILKILIKDKKLIKENVGMELTKFIVLLKTKKIDQIDQVLLRKMLKKVPISKVKVSVKLKPFISGFIKGKYSLKEIFGPLYNFALKQKSASEFRRIARQMAPNAVCYDSLANKNGINVIQPSAPNAPNAPTNAVDTSKADEIMDKFIEKCKSNDKMNENMPLVKTNKDLVKLFLIKMVNGDYLFKRTPNSTNYLNHLKKFNTTPEEIRSIVSNDDFIEMYKSEFPLNHPKLKEFYNASPTIFHNITDKLFHRSERLRFYSVFDYPFWLMKNLDITAKVLKEQYTFKVLKEQYTFKIFKGKIPSFTRENFIFIKNELPFLYDYLEKMLMVEIKETILMFRKHDNWRTYWEPILFKNYPFEDRKASYAIKNIFTGADVYTDQYIEWLKKWYESTTRENKERFNKDMAYHEVADKISFLEPIKIDEDEIKYFKFIENFIAPSSLTKPEMGMGYLKDINKVEQFKKDLEDEKFDELLYDIVSNATIYVCVDLYKEFESILLNRKRPYKMKKIIIRNLHRYLLQFESSDAEEFGQAVIDYVIDYIIEYVDDLDFLYKDNIDRLFVGLVSCLTNKNFKRFILKLKKTDKVIKYIIHDSELFGNISVTVLEECKELLKEKFPTKTFLEIVTNITYFKKWILIDENDVAEYVKIYNSERNDHEYSLLSGIYLGSYSSNFLQPQDRWEKAKKVFFKNIDTKTFFYLIGRNKISVIENFNLIENEEIINNDLLKKEIIFSMITSDGPNADENYDQLLELAFEHVLNNDEEKLIEHFKEYLENSSNMVISINTKKIFGILNLIKNKKVEIFYEILDNEKIIDSFKKIKTGSLLLDYNVIEIIDNVLDTSISEDEFENFLEKIFVGKKEATYINVMKEKFLFTNVIKEIYSNKTALIRPNDVLDHQKIMQLLTFNNVTIKDLGKIRKKKNEPLKQYFRRMRDDFDTRELIEPLKINRIVETDEQLERKTAEYLKYYTFKHGNSALEFLESFEVDMVSDELLKFKEEFPTPTVIPFFHGTGSIGASMILRYGFKILDRSSGLLTGRMMGDGIYISNIIEKSAQYISDRGFSRKTGTVGYILEGDAYLGREGINYKAAGLKKRDRIISPEWVVFDARSQLHIKKAHKVRMTTKKFVKDLAKKYNIKKETNENFISNLGMLLENKNSEPRNMITYIFYDGDVLDADGNIISFEKFNDKYESFDNILTSMGQFGPEINILTNADVLGSVHVPYTLSFKENNPENLYDKYRTFLINAVEGDYDI